MIGNHERIDETFFGNISNRLESSYLAFVVHGMNMAVNAVPVEPVAARTISSSQKSNCGRTLP